MSILHGLIAHGTTIVAESKTNKDIDDMTGRKKKNDLYRSNAQVISRTSYS